MDCEVCNKNRPNRTISGVKFCDNCFSLLNRVRNGDREAALDMISMFDGATVNAERYLSEVLKDNGLTKEQILIEKSKRTELAVHNNDVARFFAQSPIVGGRIVVRDDTKQWATIDERGNFSPVREYSKLVGYQIITDGHTI